MKLFRREKYLSRIRGFYHDDGMIKVISGVRRCGKSCLMQTIAEELKEQGVTDDKIYFYNLDKYGYRSITTEEALENLLFSNIDKPGFKYVFIDEIQNVRNFERVINELREEGGYSIFITGSNSYLLSGELATKLTGRYIEFEMSTLGFDEYEKMKTFYGKQTESSIEKEFDRYIIEGGFPKALEYDDLADKQNYVRSVVNEIYEKDIKHRVQIRNKEAFDKVQTYVINNFGATTSITNILDDLRKSGLDIKRETLNRYIKILLDAKIIYECKRFDMKSRKSIHGEQKYYLADLSFYFANNVDNRINYGPVLENVVYQYAKSVGYQVSVGRIGKLECDFIVRDIRNNYAYIQVAMTIMNSIETENREYRPFERIADGYPKYLLTRNDMIQNRNGVRHYNLPDFIKDTLLF